MYNKKYHDYISGNLIKNMHMHVIALALHAIHVNIDLFVSIKLMITMKVQRFAIVNMKNVKLKQSTSESSMNK